MKPAPSIIGFTTATGLGYGMLFVLALGAVFGLIPTARWLGAAGLLAALGLIAGGLVASTFHLGHPERAWRALTQWRSSWLSREGVLAVMTFPPALLFAFGWIVEESMQGLYGLMAIAAALGAAATVYCTGMIYASLPPIRAWHQPLTAPVYLILALMTGLLAVHVLLIAFGAPHGLTGILTLAAIAGASALKILYWRTVLAERASGPSAASATGLGASGLVRMLDPPHTQTNYLLDEMGFQIGRKHAGLLRGLAGLFGLAIPLVLTAFALTQDDWLLAGTPAVFAFVSGMIGVLIERWLFFAEAEHSVMLYYGGGQNRSPHKRAAVKSAQREAEPASVRTESRKRRRSTEGRPRAEMEGDTARSAGD